jgi:hypothetical protein
MVVAAFDIVLEVSALYSPLLQILHDLGHGIRDLVDLCMVLLFP